jgi:hypothetical protein
VPSAFLLVLAATWWTTGLGTAAFVGAMEAIGPGLLWGAAGGAGGGLLVGMVVALFKRRTPVGRGTPT